MLEIRNLRMPMVDSFLELFIGDLAISLLVLDILAILLGQVECLAGTAAAGEASEGSREDHDSDYRQHCVDDVFHHHSFQSRVGSSVGGVVTMRDLPSHKLVGMTGQVREAPMRRVSPLRMPMMGPMLFALGVSSSKLNIQHAV